MSARQAAVVYNPSNMFYLSGYTGEGLALVGSAVKAIITDFRYTEQAGQQSPGFEVCMTEKGRTHEDLLNVLCAKYGVDTLYYEDDTLTVRTFNRAREAVKGAEWKPINGATERLREIKDEGELALIEKACKITGDAFERILPQIREGMTEKQLALKLEYEMYGLGAEKLAFDTIVASGAHGSLPHAIPGENVIRRGDMITLDFGAKVGGYCADMTRTVALGEPSDEMRRVYQTVREAQELAQNAVAAGKDCRAVDQLARDYIDNAGYAGRFGHGLGHSLGIDIHESPRLSQLATGALKPNQLMTVEPGVYLPGVGGVRIENTVVVLDGGCRALTLPTRELIIL